MSFSIPRFIYLLFFSDIFASEYKNKEEIDMNFANKKYSYPYPFSAIVHRKFGKNPQKKSLRLLLAVEIAKIRQNVARRTYQRSLLKVGLKT